MKIITKRKAPIIRDAASARLTLTYELIESGVDIDKEEEVTVSVVESNGKKMILIEKTSQ